MARKLKEQGFKLVLVDEKSCDLDAFAAELDAEKIEFDFKHLDKWESYEQLCEYLSAGRDISVLVNNVQLLDYRKGKVWRASDDELREMVTANTYPMIFMLRGLGGKMRERTSNSSVINMTSYHADHPNATLPCFSAGAACKSFVSEAVYWENQKYKNFHVMTVKPLLEKSERHPNGAEASEIVEGVFTDLSNKERFSFGHWKHSMFRSPRHLD